jgi:sarcosine oxidase subunit beta
MVRIKSKAESFDVILVGGGMLGVSTAYHLSRKGAQTLLLQAGDIGGGSSAACSGRAQVAEGNLDVFSLSLVRQGMTRLETLEAELEMSFSFRRSGFLALIDSPDLWEEWVDRAEILSSAGIPTEILDRKDLQAAEPHLNTNGFLGAAYAVEGLLNPFLFCWAYANAAKRSGARIMPNTPVTDMHVDGQQVVAVLTDDHLYSSKWVAVMCGAWTTPVLQLAGAYVPVYHTHAQAFITNPVSLKLNNTIELANFYDLIHGKDHAIAVGFSQDLQGALIVTEAVQKSPELHTRSTAWGIAGMAADLIRLYPDLAEVHVVRAWGAPTPFTPDEEPVIGCVPGFDNLFTAAGFMQTITSIPVVSEWMAQMLLGELLNVNLDGYSPARFPMN